VAVVGVVAVVAVVPVAVVVAVVLVAVVVGVVLVAVVVGVVLVVADVLVDDEVAPAGHMALDAGAIRFVHWAWAKLLLIVYDGIV